MADLPKEKGYLIGAVVLVLASAGTFGWFTWQLTAGPRQQVATIELSDAPYPPTVAEAEVVKTDNWVPPVAQTRGREWIYEAFTPPEILYNARSRKFTVKPPAAAVAAEEAANDEPFGVDLVSVRADPFRLQLIGFVGGEGNYRGTFENVGTGEVFLATSGRRVPKLGLTIKRFEVRPVEIKIPQSMTTRQLVASAVILDEKTNQEVTITHRERHFTGGYAAFVAQTGEAATREVREGETFRYGEASYKVDKITLSPPSIDLTKESPTIPVAAHQQLTPREVDETAAPAAPDTPPGSQ